MNRKLVVMVLIILNLSANTSFAVVGDFDETILQDPVKNAYLGTTDAEAVIGNIDFIDVPASNWAKEAVTRSGALDIVKGYERRYRPNDQVTNEEVMAFIIRAIGQEGAAQIEGEKINLTLPALLTDPAEIWSYGYMKIAQSFGIITAAQYSDVLQTDPTMLIPGESFYRKNKATREQVAEWIVKAIKAVDPTVLQETRGQQYIYNYIDWKQIDEIKVPYVESVLTNNIMQGDAQKMFKPKAYLTRAELAQIMKNIDNIYFNAMKMKRDNGYIGEIVDETGSKNGETVFKRTVYVRNSNGDVDTIIAEKLNNIIGQSINQDVVVFKDGKVSGVAELKKQDKIEYITNSKGVAVYILATKIDVETVAARFKDIDFNVGELSVYKEDDSIQTYKLRNGIINKVVQTIIIDGEETSITKMPFSTNMRVTLKNNIVDKIEMQGEVKQLERIKGIVKSIDKITKQIMVIDQNNLQINKYWVDGVTVEKNNAYNLTDEVGYIDQMFSNYDYDERDSTVDKIEVGDVVELLLNEKGYVDKISVDTNYVVRYANVKQLNLDDPNETGILVQYEDFSNDLITIGQDTYISKNGRKIDAFNIMPGDWIEMLVKRSIFKPGQVIETVKEIVVNGKEEYITDIYRGQLSHVDRMQNKMMISNVETFYKNGFKDYQNIFELKIGDNVSWYNDGKQVSLDYVDKFLKNDDTEVYIAVKKRFNEEQAEKVTFRTEKEKVLNTDNINYVSGEGNFKITYLPDNITTDLGTIVRRHGRLVDSQNISMLDYAKVVLNGENKAAIVDIGDEIDNSRIQVFRGRVENIETNKNFTVSSSAILQDVIWTYVPIERQFDIDYKTKIYIESGLVKHDTFIDYTDASKLDAVYTIVVKGGQVEYLSDAPYCTEAATGEIYDIQNGIIFLKDVKQYDSTTSVFEDISRKDKTLKVQVLNNGVIVKNGEIIKTEQLKIGDTLQVMTNRKPSEVKAENNIVKGYITFVTK